MGRRAKNKQPPPAPLSEFKGGKYSSKGKRKAEEEDGQGKKAKLSSGVPAKKQRPEAAPKGKAQGTRTVNGGTRKVHEGQKRCVEQACNQMGMC